MCLFSSDFLTSYYNYITDACLRQTFRRCLQDHLLLLTLRQRLFRVSVFDCIPPRRQGLQCETFNLTGQRPRKGQGRTTRPHHETAETLLCLYANVVPHWHIHISNSIDRSEGIAAWCHDAMYACPCLPRGQYSGIGAGSSGNFSDRAPSSSPSRTCAGLS